MGYANYTIHRDGQQIEAGYAVEDICNEDACPVGIDRGLAFLCGDTPGGDEYGCGGYFCEAHLFISTRQGEPQLCTRCSDAADKRAAEELISA
jgi:hypothetical protein